MNCEFIIEIVYGTMNMKEKILAYIKGRERANVREISNQLEISPSMTHRYLKALMQDGCVQKVGTAPKVAYILSGLLKESDSVSSRRKPENRIFGPPHAVFNLSRMGLRYFRIGIEASPESRGILVKHFSGHPNVGWIFSAEGWFNLAVGIWAKDNAEINDISSQIRMCLGKGDRIVFQSELTSLHGFGNRPVTGGNEAMCIVDAATNATYLSPLKLDYIKLIALDSSLGHAELGKILGVDVDQLVAIMLQINGCCNSYLGKKFPCYSISCRPISWKL